MSQRHDTEAGEIPSREDLNPLLQVRKMEEGGHKAGHAATSRRWSQPSAGSQQGNRGLGPATAKKATLPKT